MFSFILKLCQLVREHGVAIVKDVQVRAELQGVQDNFVSYYKFLTQLVRQLAEKGQFRELHLRLDFNKYFSNN